MRFTETDLAGAWIIDLQRIEDHRGFFARSWCEKEFLEHGLNPRVSQRNIGYNAKQGTLRGLHFQLAPDLEAKLLSVTRGAVYDVIVDLRPDSRTFCRWISVELSADNRRMLYAPAGFAHGYQTLQDDTELQYLATAPFAPKSARGVRFDDPAFGISWPLPVTAMSDADRNWPALDRSSLDFSATGQPKSGN
jgi:dTDP-4-dehydrorhamnose 3,5-epimerase